MQQLVLAGANSLELQKQARAEGVASMRDDGLERVRRGETTWHEVEHATHEPTL